MDMQGSRQLAVTQQQAWDALNDPEVLKLCIPGCDKVEPTGENQYAMGMALKVGPVSAKFSGKITLTDIQAPESYKLSFEGQGGPAGFGKGSAAVKLTPNEGGCDLSYSVNATVGGKIAQLGQRLIDGVAKSMAEDFFKRFDDEMQRRYPPIAVASSQPAVVADSGPKSAKVPGWAWAALALAIAAAGYFLAR
jgi:uncharacterized protein